MRAVEIRQLRKSYGQVEVIKGIDLTIEAGEFVSLLGPSGCGKTTLLRMIAGLEVATDGAIVIGDRDCTNLPPEKRNISMVFQSYALIPHLSVLENVMFPLEMRNIGATTTRRSEAMAALEMVGLAHLSARRPRQLSGGQQQRVAVARAVVSRPDVLLLDEPLSNLDAAMREKMQEELITLHRATGLTTIFVTHDQEEALSLSDRVILLNGGKIEQQGNPQELYNAPATRFAASFIGATNLLTADIGQEGSARIAHLPGGQPLRLPDTVTATGSGYLSLRQEDIILARAGSGIEGLPGVIENRVYLGARVRYVIRTAAGELRCLAAPDQQFGVGDSVVVTILPERIRFLAA
ncbi:MAG: Fe3+/spermidine/putrescine ABC transporter ATP-binding protein [Rhodobacteraceae bacterium GWE1_64_9]|nr:MAG: Fe3+/spermidine/putrescine ABC transporter ATP-binding protein [Rhodobacteraceae bacterium GWE1_64_9]HBD91498.1 ABC transporter ATP-binding protein [Gemmobacter sp.]